MDYIKDLKALSSTSLENIKKAYKASNKDSSADPSDQDLVKFANQMCLFADELDGKIDNNISNTNSNNGLFDKSSSSEIIPETINNLFGTDTDGDGKYNFEDLIEDKFANGSMGTWEVQGDSLIISSKDSDVKKQIDFAVDKDNNVTTTEKQIAGTVDDGKILEESTNTNSATTDTATTNSTDGKILESSPVSTNTNSTTASTSTVAAETTRLNTLINSLDQTSDSYLTQLQSALEDATANYSTAQTNYTKAAEEVDKKQKTVQSLQEQIQNNDKVKSAINSNEAVNSAKKALKQNKDDQKTVNDNITKADTEITNNTKKISECNTKISSLNSSISQQNTIANSAMKTVEKTDADGNTTQEQVPDDAARSAAREQVTALTAQLETEETNKKDAETAKKKAEEDKSNYQKELDKLAAEEPELTTKLSEEIQKATEEVASSDSSVSALVQQLTQAQNELNTAVTNLGTAKTDLSGALEVKDLCASKIAGQSSVLKSA